MTGVRGRVSPNIDHAESRGIVHLGTRTSGWGNCCDKVRRVSWDVSMTHGKGVREGGQEGRRGGGEGDGGAGEGDGGGRGGRGRAGDGVHESWGDSMSPLSQ